MYNELKILKDNKALLPLVGSRDSNSIYITDDSGEGYLGNITLWSNEKYVTYLPKNRNITLLQTNWNSLTKQYVLTLNDLPNDLLQVDFGIPIPTTFVNRDAFTTADIICVSINSTSITFECKVIPTTNINICLKY